jgi:hypothetical protein
MKSGHIGIIGPRSGILHDSADCAINCIEELNAKVFTFLLIPLDRCIHFGLGVRVYFDLNHGI